MVESFRGKVVYRSQAEIEEERRDLEHTKTKQPPKVHSIRIISFNFFKFVMALEVAVNPYAGWRKEETRTPRYLNFQRTDPDSISIWIDPKP